MPLRPNPQYFANLRLEEGRRNLAAFGGRKSRSAASSMYPYLQTNSRAVAASLTRPQGSIASRIYPHLPSSAAARMQKPKPKPRGSLARRIYGDEY
jgi:hypothetical protein